MLTDTIPKTKKKETLEKQLKNLEIDIDMLERNSNIYVCEQA